MALMQAAIFQKQKNVRIRFTLIDNGRDQVSHAFYQRLQSDGLIDNVYVLTGPTSEYHGRALKFFFDDPVNQMPDYDRILILDSDIFPLADTSVRKLVDEIDQYGISGIIRHNNIPSIVLFGVQWERLIKALDAVPQSFTEVRNRHKQLVEDTGDLIARHCMGDQIARTTESLWYHAEMMTRMMFHRVNKTPWWESAVSRSGYNANEVHRRMSWIIRNFQLYSIFEQYGVLVPDDFEGWTNLRRSPNVSFENL